MPEIMSTFDFNQVEPKKSLDTCGFAAVALCFAAGPPGQAPLHPVAWAIQKMGEWYTEYDGPDVLSNTKGMTVPQLYTLIVEKGGHYQAIAPNAASIASWIKAKYPVIIAVTESSVFDVHLGRNPYTWDTSHYNHIITVTGIDHDHVFLCRDTVNQHEGSPYSYDGDKLVYLSATVFVPTWLPRPVSAIAPAIAPVPLLPLPSLSPSPSSLPSPHLSEGSPAPMAAISLTTPGVSHYYRQEAGTSSWVCITTGFVVQGAILAYYQQFGNAGLCGLTYIGLPLGNEEPCHIADHPECVKQQFERAWLAYDPAHVMDTPPGSGAVYAMHQPLPPPIDTTELVAAQAEIATLQKKIAGAQAQLQ